MSDSILIAVTLQRRSITGAIFRRHHLEDLLVRQFPHEQQKATNSVTGFLERILEEHDIELAVFETNDVASEHVKQLVVQAKECFRAEGIPLVEVRTETLFQNFAIPPLRRRDQLRSIARSFWPLWARNEPETATPDAAALGLYAATERLFNIYSEQT